MDSERKNYSSIDLMKFISAFLVIGIHTSPFEQYTLFDYGFSLLTRVAVPFFFVSSAFLYFRKPISIKRTFTYCKRILILYFIWSIVYILFGFIEAGSFDVDVLLGFVKTFAVQGYKHLWFLWAIFLAVLIASLFDLYVKNKYAVYIFAAVFYIAGLIMSTYSTPLFRIDGFESIYNYVSFNIGFRNGLVYGLPFVLIGRYFAKNEEIPGLKVSIIGLIVSFIMLAAESFVVIKVITTKDTILWISVLPLMYFLFSFILNVNLKEHKILLLMRKSSVLMYCIHPMIISLLSLAISNNLVMFLSTSVISVIISVLIYKLSTKKHFTFLKYLQ